MKNGPYILVKAPENYPGRLYRGKYVYEHQLVWWQNTGELIPKDSVIHHKNENKHDNRIENLEIQTRAIHTSEHHEPAEVEQLTCEWCNVEFTRTKRIIKGSKKQGNIHIFCGPSCQMKYQWEHSYEDMLNALRD